MSVESTKPEIPKAIPCDCCGDPIEYTAFLDVWKEDKLGYVCADCKYRLRIANVWLKHFNCKTCEFPSPQVMLTRNRPIQ